MFAQETAPHVSGATPEIFDAIHEEGVNLAVWERLPDRRTFDAVEALMDTKSQVRLDVSAPGKATLEALLLSLVASNTPRQSVFALASDIFNLSRLFGNVAGLAHPRVRLERVSDDGCALFHADTLSVRMLCTYAGAGTEWLENNNIRRGQLGIQGRSIAEANAAIVQDPASIRRIPRSHVAILTGRLWPGGEENALVHRSAPVSTPKASRLRLCVDSACDC